MEAVVLLDRQEPLDLPEHQVVQDQVEVRDRVEHQDPQDLVEAVVLLDRQEHQVVRDRGEALDRVEVPEAQEVRDQPDPRVHQVLEQYQTEPLDTLQSLLELQH